MQTLNGVYLREYNRIDVLLEKQQTLDARILSKCTSTNKSDLLIILQSSTRSIISSFTFNNIY